jgi:acyl-CoA thioester hydrolase
MTASSPDQRRGWYGSFDLTQPATFAYFTDESLRFADLDSNGHVNNVTFAVFFENARVRYLGEVFAAAERNSSSFVLAHLSIDFLAQMFYPGTVRCGVRLVEVRRSSVVIGQAVFRDGQATAVGHAVMVVADKASGRARPFEPALRARLDALVGDRVPA